MKRYGFQWSGLGATSDFVEKPEGEFVKLEEVQNKIDRLTAEIGIMAERIDLQTQWMLEHGITTGELGEILSKLAVCVARKGTTGGHANAESR